jgi:amidohydrolase
MAVLIIAGRALRRYLARRGVSRAAPSIILAAMANLGETTNACRGRMIETRRDLHAHPELGFEEVRTAALVAARLRALGLAPREGIARTGVTAVLEGGAGAGPCLLVRADMDALPIEEATGAPYASRHPGKMHACGHDGHTAILLALAEALAAERARLRGRVVLLFQPAEEGPGGAKPMIEAGVLEEPRVDAAIGLHLSTGLEIGEVAADAGPVMAAVDEFELAITSDGGHGALPQQVGDPIVAAAQVVLGLQTIISREKDPLAPAVVTVGEIRGGSRKNVIPAKVTIGGTVRTHDPALRDAIPGQIERVACGMAGALRCGCALAHVRYYPATVNDARMAALVRGEAAAVVGERGLREHRGMWSEDFSYFGEKVPACFFFVGARNRARGLAAPHHSAGFDFDEDALAIGLEIFRRAVFRFCGSEPA